MIFKQFNPLKGVDTHNPILSYALRNVRGGRTEAGLIRYSWYALLITWAVVLTILLLTLILYRPSGYVGDNFRLEVVAIYAAGLTGVSIVLFFVVDLVTIFYAVMVLRMEVARPVKFDLLRLSLLPPENYLNARLILAKVRAWRVYVVMWAARALAWALLILVGMIALIVVLVDNPPEWNDIFSTDFFFVLNVFVVAIAIFTVMLLFEPIWRFEMLTKLAGSVAVRLRISVLMWLGMGFAFSSVLVLQGIFATLVVYLGIWIYSIIYEIIPYSYDFREQFGITLAILPYIGMVPGVWLLQGWLARWRGQVGAQYVFLARGDDA